MPSPRLSSAEPIVELRDVSMDFALGGMFAVKRSFLRALSGISLRLHEGRALALVGESGSGKSTCARLISGINPPTAGEVRYRGGSIAHMHRAALFAYRAEVQMVFQDPFGSLNPTQTVGYHIERPLRLHNKGLSRADVRSRIVALLDSVGLAPGREFASRQPHELSGGQRQRVAIARALSVEPSVLLADEPTSMLDASVRLGILNLLEDMKQARNLAILYITHDIATARYLAEDIAVLYAGHLVEYAPSDVLTERPQHPYTQLLISSIPNPANRIKPGAGRRAADIPMWTADKAGCPFVSRCPRLTQICREVMPPPTQISESHSVNCHNL